MNSIPYYHRSVDWEALVDKHPPPPLYAETIGNWSNERLRAFQNELFMARVSEAWRIPFFAARWESVGLEPGDIRSIDDIEKIPIYNAEDLKEAIAERPPFGSHQPVTREDFGDVPLKVQTSGGTTGMPRVTLFDPVAWEVQAIQGARSLWNQGVRPGDIAQIPRTCSLANAAWLEYKACHDWLGVVPVTSGSGVVTPTERQLEYAKMLGVNVWIANVEYLGRIAEVAEETSFDLGSLGTKLIHSYLGNDPNGYRRGALEDAFQAPIYDDYGTHEIGEIAGECSHRTTLHVNDDTVFLETASLDTGEILPIGSRGSLIATSLHRSFPPIIRYDVGDIMTVYPRSLCTCGVRATGLSHFQGRADEMVKVRGQNVFPRALESILYEIPGCNGQYLCIASHAGSGIGQRTELTVRVERQSRAVEAAPLQGELEARFKKILGVRVAVSIEDPGALAELTGYSGREGKVRRLLDNRSL